MTSMSQAAPPRAPSHWPRRAVLRLVAWGLLAGSIQPAVAGVTRLDASPMSPELRSALPDAQALGAARLTFFGLEIYDAQLRVGPGFQADHYARHALGLELRYRRSLSGADIAARSLKEMRRAGPIEPATASRWQSAMESAFPDVGDGDRLTGVHEPGVGARFWFNGAPRPPVLDPEFSRLFFGIWLSTATSEPELRSLLLSPPTGRP
jgi:hypothetical protein